MALQFKEQSSSARGNLLITLFFKHKPHCLLQVFREVKVEGFNKEDYLTQQIFYSSKDGTKVPMFIIHKRGLKLDGQNPCLLYGYGGFNVSVQPGFSVIRLIFIQLTNGVLAVPSIRGGG